MAEQLKIQTSVYLAQKMRSTVSTAGSIDMNSISVKPSADHGFDPPRDLSGEPGQGIDFGSDEQNESSAVHG